MARSRFLCLALGAALGLVLGRTSSSSQASLQFSPQEFLGPIKYLSSDALKGRGNGTPELDEAARYIAAHFKRDGLRPAGDGGTYLQQFMVTTGSTLGPGNSVAYEDGGARHPLALHEDYLPLSFSGDVTVEAPLVFAGYGITAPEYHYDDYRGIDAKGKIVIVLRHEPQENDEKSVFEGKQYTPHAEIVNKAINARDHGAAGMVLVNDLGNHPGDADGLINLSELAGPEEMRLAVVQVKAAVVDEWLKPSGQTLDGLRQAIDRDLSNQSFALGRQARLSLTVYVQRVRKPVANVVGILPGADASLVRQSIVIGAHYDHLGLGQQHSLAPSQIGQIHHGADDNASGTSGLLELAEAFAHSTARPKHTLVFIAFAGEELGLLGSSYYTAHPVVPLADTMAMINMDMIGRVSQNRVYIGGTGTSPDFKKLVEDANAGGAPDASAFAISYSASGYGASDQTSFTARGVPVLFFFSGLHSDYHKPSDTWEKIDAADGARVVGLVARCVESLDALTAKPQYVRVAEPASRSVGGGGGYGPYFGSIPDFGQVEHGGVKFADVHDGSPAGKAGFKAGDVLVQFGDKKIDNLYDFTYALRAHKPGDKVMVTVLRNGEKFTREVTLEERK